MARHPQQQQMPTLDLTRHSLNAVVACDKTLWQQPLKWTRAHLSTLGIPNEEEEDSRDTNDDDNGVYGGEGERGGNYHVRIPDLPPAVLGRYMASFLKPARYETRVFNLIMLLRLPRQCKLTPIIDGHGDADENHQRRDDSISQPFASRWMMPKLVVGQREYEVKLLFHLLVSDTLVLPYVDSTCVPQLPFLFEHRRNSTRPFEPFVAAVLISRAQSLYPPLLGNEGAVGGQSKPNSSVYHVCLDKTAKKPTLITTQLLFTHRNDQQNIHVYTAHISHALLDRFRYPNQPPATAMDHIGNHFMDPIIRLNHHRVPYEPQVTFRQRLLAAVSITPIIMPNAERDPDCRKRALSPDAHVHMISAKRRRRPEYLRALS
ncbi:hypothetical protein RRF57_012956 [Xylaria bambusicola]|uniref:Uncharacterized protein n=1 Tax=Xylaria bambusicola TaxID=326684 RepID=A0AAN7V4S8_9PEZI